jgi:hypothetical protein
MVPSRHWTLIQIAAVLIHSAALQPANKEVISTFRGLVTIPKIDEAELED